MSMSSPKHHLRIDQLEDRLVPSSASAIWQNTNVTLSFAPDGTSINGVGSALSSKLNGSMTQATWQLEMLKAFQTWASVTNLNIGVVSDTGLAFGTNGQQQGDYRFGDIRIGAMPLLNDVLLINNAPNPMLADTWSGDIFLNTNRSFNQGGGMDQHDLYSAMLNEAGNVLGLKDTDVDITSALYSHYAFRTGINTSDVAAIQGKYGIRSKDVFDLAWDNGTLANASILFGGQAIASQTSVKGDLTTSSDVDWYRFTALGGNMSFQLNTQGLSLLTGKMTIYNSSGTQIATTQTTDPLNNNLQISSLNLTGGQSYYIKVEKGQNNFFGIGGYELVLKQGTFSSAAPTGNWADKSDGIPTANDQVRLANDGDSDDTANQAVVLPVDSRFQTNWRYQHVSNLHNFLDRDYYAIRSPQTAGPQESLRVTVRTAETTTRTGRIQIYNQSNELVSTTILTNSNGTHTVQLNNPQPNQTYYVVVQNASGAIIGLGNYVLVAEFVEQGNDNTIATARTWNTNNGAAPVQFGSLATNLDVDHFRVTSPGASNTQSAMQIQLRSVNNSSFKPVVRVMNSQGVEIPAKVIRNAQGVYSIEIQNVAGSQDLFLEVKDSKANVTRTTNAYYAMEVRFLQNQQTSWRTLANLTLTNSNRSDYSVLTAETSQLFTFNLGTNVGSGNQNVAVRMTIYNQNGQVVFTLNAVAGQPRTADVFLNAGYYIIRFDAATSDGSALPSVSIQLGGGSVSDPISPIVEDPTDVPPPDGNTEDDYVITYLPDGTVAVDPTTNQPLFVWLGSETEPEDPFADL